MKEERECEDEVGVGCVWGFWVGVADGDEYEVGVGVWVDAGLVGCCVGA